MPFPIKKLSWFRNEQGYTVLELSITLLLIIFLMAIAAATFLGQVTQAQDAKARTYLANAYRVTLAEALFENGEFPSINNLAPMLNEQVTNTVIEEDPEGVGSNELGVVISEGRYLVLAYKSASGNLFILQNTPLQPVEIIPFDQYTPPVIP